MVEIGFDKRLLRILDHEIAMRANAKVARRTREAGFGMRAAPEEFELTDGCGITQGTFQSLISLHWICNRQPPPSPAQPG
jgi:hypothetical protein